MKDKESKITKVEILLRILLDFFDPSNKQNIKESRKVMEQNFSNKRWVDEKQANPHKKTQTANSQISTLTSCSTEFNDISFFSKSRSQNLLPFKNFANFGKYSTLGCV